MSTQIYQANDLLNSRTIIDEAGDPVDLTGATLDYQISKKGDETAVVSLSDGSGITITDAAGGALEIDLSATDTDVPKGTYVHELRVTLSSGKKYTAFSEDLEIRDSIFATD